MPTQQVPGSPHDDSGVDASLDEFGNPVGGSFPPDFHQIHHLRLKALLLTIWVVFSFGIVYFARDLQALVPGHPTAYWMAAQGAILMFLGIIVAYCVAMDHLEREAARDEAVVSPDSRLPHG